MKKMIRAALSPFIVAGVIGLAGLGSIATSTDALAYACKSYPTQAVGVRKLKYKANVIARKGWSSIVKSNLGLPWSVWKIAKQKSITCVKINTSQGKKWRCLASAKPCKYVVQ